MFDPERDEIDTRPYGLRLALIALIALAIGGALMPSVTGYRAGPDGQASCIAVRDAWSARSAPVATSGWLDGAGACLAGARHRLFLTAAGLGAIGVVGVGSVLVTASRRRMRLHANEPASFTSA